MSKPMMAEAGVLSRPLTAALTHSVPVGLNEAALDSPTFRATASHFADQIDAIERWLNGYVSSSSKLFHDVQALEETINSYLVKTVPTAANGIVDNDYTFLALKRVGDGSREYWMQMLNSIKRMDALAVEPIRSFLAADMRNFKEIRRGLEHAQRAHDSALSRYASQSKTKEPSALREDAFALYESRKTYLTASMDFCQHAPQLLFVVDKLLVKISTELWREMKRSRDAVTSVTRWGQEMDRIRGWAKEMEASENVFRKELQMMRRELSDATLEDCKPSRELEDYSASTVPYLGSRGPVNLSQMTDGKVISEKQGWLFIRVASGKPVRHNWLHRWYYCRDGVFGWLIPGPHGVLQGDEIGVLLCNAKPAVSEDRRFCFEIKTKSQNLIFQAESQKQLTEWLEVFEASKKKAFEVTMSRDNNALTGGIDPAFSISPPTMPEFSAKQLDSPLGPEEPNTGVDRVGTLSVPPADGGLATRQSFDVSGGVPRRSITALGRDLAREEGESGREHAARIIQKLDSHRKAAFGSGAEPTGPPANNSGGGIASLISASHNLLPTYTGAQLPSPPSKTNTGTIPSLDTRPGSLAPLTLAKPPAITNLSRAAVVNSAERSASFEGSKIPTPIMANYWGSNVWATVRVAEQAALPRHSDDDPIGVVVSESVQTPLSVTGQGGKVEEVFPPRYPPELRSQHQQFRLLFPNVPQDEKLVLVFRAMWASSSSQEAGKPRLAGDGRIFATAENLYFYGHQIGLVTAFMISLDAISEVMALAGRDADQIVLHLGHDNNTTGLSRIAIKTFLDDIRILQHRLNLLIDNLQAEEPMDTAEIISSLTNIDTLDDDKPSPSAESWEEVSANTPADDGTAGGRPVVDRGQAGPFSPSLQPTRSRPRNPPKLHLPTHPVIYEPEDMNEVAEERQFEISAKACFHVLFGDKSFVFPKLYFERRAQQIAQGPWSLADHGQMQRQFQFKVDYVDMLGRSKTADVNDHQTIDVYNDHATYVVTHTKTAWHLPHSSCFKLVTKIVITHFAKSKCKLGVYVRIDWSKEPALSKNLVERQALRDAKSDAQELAELATDQVRKLGGRSRTNRAIQVYGHVGQQTQVVVFSPAAKGQNKKQAVTPRTLVNMVFETVRSIAESVVTSLMMWAFAGVRKVFQTVSAQRLLLLLLGISMLANMLWTSNETATWLGERRAASFMQRVGVGPNVMMSKAIYLSNLAEAGSSTNSHLSFPQNSTCYSTYERLVEATDLDAPWEDAGSLLSSTSSRAVARRLRRTRRRLGSYRHDLLVAMRVVNTIEREMLYSEWENWLSNEMLLCDDLETILRMGSGGGGDGEDVDAEQDTRAQKVMRAVPASRRSILEEWKNGHCRSCRGDFVEVRRSSESVDL